jgi:hypothetical protein
MGFIMKKLSSLLVLGALLSSTVWAADCKVPEPPRKMPDGTTAKKEEMIAFKKLVDQYNGNTNTYLACIKEEHEKQLAKYPKGDEELKKNFMESYQKKNDAAVDVAQEFVGRFNEQLRAFKAKNP